MALTDANKAKIRRYLGYPDVNRLTYYELEGALGAISSDGETIATGLLTSLDALHTALQDSWSRQKVVRAEEVTLAGPDEIRALRAEGRRLSAELAALFDVPVLVDVWGSGGGSGTCLRG